MKTCITRLTLLIALALACGCQRHQKSHGHGVHALPRVNFDFRGRYDALRTTAETSEPLSYTLQRDGKIGRYWLIPHFHSQQPAIVTVANSAPTTTLEQGSLYINAPSPVVKTTKVRSAGVGTIMVVEIEQGTGKNGEVHRVYFLGPAGHSVEVDRLPWAGGTPEQTITSVNHFVEFDTASNTLSKPAPIDSVPERAAFIKRILHTVNGK